MRNFFEPADATVTWLRDVLSSIRAALSDKWPTALRLWSATTVNLPTTAALGANPGALAYDDTVSRPTYYNSSAWVSLMPYTAGAALTAANDTNITLTLGGSPTNALLQAASVTAGWTGTLSVARGGTGVGTVTGILQGNGTSAFSAITVGSGLTFSGGTLDRAALTGDVTTSVNVATLATVNANVGSWGSATQAPQITLDGKGRATAAANVTITPAIGSVTGLGTGVATALGVNVGSAGALVVNGGALGTPSSGTLTNCTFPTLNQNTTGSAATLTTGRTIAMTGDVAWTSPSFNGSANVTAAGTLATVNASPGPFGSATQSLTATVNGKGLVTAMSAQTVTPAVGSITGLGTGVATFLATPSSANLAAAVTDETGTAGSLVFSASPTLTGTLTAAAINASGSIGAGAATPLGYFAGDYLYRNSTSDKFAIYASLNATAAGGYTIAYGESHATKPNVVEVGTNGAVRASFSSTGLAVTGTGSFTKTMSNGSGITTLLTLTSSAGAGGDGAAVELLANIYKTAKIGSSLTGTDLADLILYTGNGAGGYTARGTFNAAGLAVTGSSTATTYLKSGSYTVAGLPAAGTAGAGARAFVTDATVTTFASTVAGGGANAVPVYSDGTNWRIG